MARKLLTVLTVLCGVASALAGSAHNGRRDHQKLVRVRSSNLTIETEPNATVLKKRAFTNTRFTFYEAGLGACGGYNSDSDFIVAMNSDQYAGGAHCYEMITVSYNGKSAQAQVVDECPTCPWGALDLTPSLFQQFASEDAGEIYGSWSFNSDSEQTTTSTKQQETTTSSIWTPTSTSTWWTSTSTSTSKTKKSSSTSTWSSTSSTWSSSSTSSTPTSTFTSSTSSTSTSSSLPTPSADSALDELNYAVMQLGQVIAAGAQVTLATYETE